MVLIHTNFLRMTSQQKDDTYHLPDAAPHIIKGDVSGTDSLPWALYSIQRAIPETSLNHLVTDLEQGFVISVPSGEDIHLVRLAPTSSLYQPSLESALKAHIQYGNDNKSNLAYFPYGLLVVSEKYWTARGLWLISVDFEDGNPVTAFRLKTTDLGQVCETLRNDDDSASQMEEDYKMTD